MKKYTASMPIYYTRKDSLDNLQATTTFCKQTLPHCWGFD